MSDLFAGVSGDGADMNGTVLQVRESAAQLLSAEWAQVFNAKPYPSHFNSGMY